ncbi:deacetylase [Methylophaga frappieri]|uniref:histone deacetylase n=1 Tax=Methylophaga frappieri (strain ATCC BAA-2434 / DSM 25690 / JAM7) TaxID=754477 RepID=I1YI54_METFJ|nr:histone deacetylase [Methylophaga frappieri]AFJ02597.1 deacetylase [Methylophaga frappieri]
MQRRKLLKLAGLACLPASLRAVSASSNESLKTGLVLDDRFVDYQITPDHPESPARYRQVAHTLNALHRANKVTSIAATPAKVRWLSTIHSIEHQASIKRHAPEAYATARLAAGGVLNCVDAVMQEKVKNAFCASRPPGHHATNTGREEGFCYFNHVAIAARYAQQQYGLERILIVDWDYHHGNGTEWAFYDDPSVLFFSTHDRDAYPRTGLPERTGHGAGEGFNINVHLPCGSGDAAMLAAFKEKLLPAANAFSPQLVLISAGFDSRVDDLLGCHEITDDGFKALTKMVMQIAARHCQGRLVSVLEGGYHIPGLVRASQAHITALSSLSG